jgi:LmbE family N-acetylglucosaminyl deacetylase
MADVVLSPHLDDAVLSCWRALDRPEPATVVNVFSGAPPAGAPVGWWDRITGATDSAARMRERGAEDGEALTLAGARARDLRLLDHQYRSTSIGAADLAAALEHALDADAVVHAPAAIDGHPDHVVVRDAAVRLATGARSLVLYADLPHAVRHGWPAWVTGEPGPPGIDVGADWEAALRRSGLVVDRLIPRAWPLDAACRGRKLAALSAYRTQRTALDRLAFAPLDDPRTLAWEVTWDVPRSALRGADEAGREALVADAGGNTGDDRV